METLASWKKSDQANTHVFIVTLDSIVLCEITHYATIAAKVQNLGDETSPNPQYPSDLTSVDCYFFMHFVNHERKAKKEKEKGFSNEKNQRTSKNLVLKIT